MKCQDDHRHGGGRSSPAPADRRGLTIVELLVVVGLVSLMLGFLFPVAGAVRTHGRKVREMSAARQLMVAYLNYSTDNRGALLPGYKSGLRVSDHRGRALGDPIAARYPWRLAPYLDLSLPGLFVDTQRAWLEEFEQSDPETFVYGVSLNPSLGLNVTWVGGNQREYGFNPTLERYYGPIYVKNYSEFLHPERLLVFASARGDDPAGGEMGAIEGFFMTASPRLTAEDGERWPEEYDPRGEPRDYGHLSLRYDGEAVIAYADGHTGELDWWQLRDMRHWANWAQTPDYGLEPLSP